MAQLDSANPDVICVELLDSDSVIIPLAFVKEDSGMCRKHSHLVMAVFVQLQFGFFYACLLLFECWCKSLQHHTIGL